MKSWILKSFIALCVCCLCLPSSAAFGAVSRASRPLPAGLLLTEQPPGQQPDKTDKEKKKKKKKDKEKKAGKEKRQKNIVPAPQRISTLPEEEQRRFDYYFLEAARLKIQQQYDAALELLQHCLDINPEDAAALYEMAQFHIYLKQVPQAIAALEKAVANDPDNYWYAQGLANLYRQHVGPQKAVDLLKEMTVRFPDKLDPLYSLLDIYNSESRYDDLIDILNLLEERTGKNEQISMEKFRIYLQQKDDRRAFSEIEALVAEYPMEMRYRVILGDVYLQNDKPDEALRIYREVLQEEPDNVQAMYSLAAYYEQTGQQELYNSQLDSLLLNRKLPADTRLQVMRRLVLENERDGGDSLRIIRLFNRVTEQETDDAEPALFYARYLLSKGMQAEAMPVLRQVLDIDPSNSAARMTLLGDAVRRQDNADMVRLCEAGVESNPDMLEFYFYLAIGYNQDERTDDVVNVCRRALLHVTPKSNKEVVSDFYTILGDSYHTLQQNEQAYLAYDSALVYNPANVGALNNYAYYLSLERRDLDKAEEMSYRTVKAEPNNATYLDTYAWILFEKGRYAEARLFIDDAMRGDGAQSDVIVEHCGDIYYKVGEVEEAVKYWKQSLDMGNTSEKLKQKIARKKYIE